MRPDSSAHCSGFDQQGNQANVTPEQLNLGPLADNGGLTMTHALQTDPAVSAAINQIPKTACSVDTDQRGEPRPETGGDTCDVGAFELQPDE